MMNMKTSANLGGTGMGPITVDPETGQVTFGGGSSSLLLIGGIAVAAYLVWTKVLGKRGLF